MDIFNVFKNRKSVRSYKEDPVSDDVLVKVLEAARLAPSAGNVQPWHFIVVKDKEKRQAIAKGCRYGKFLSESPVVIVACGNKEASPNFYCIDTAIALEHIVLAATALGLGSCWVGIFNKIIIREMINLPKRFEIVALLALGYPRKKIDFWRTILHSIRTQKRYGEIVSEEKYG